MYSLICVRSWTIRTSVRFSFMYSEYEDVLIKGHQLRYVGILIYLFIVCLVALNHPISMLVAGLETIERVLYRTKHTPQELVNCNTTIDCENGDGIHYFLPMGCAALSVSTPFNFYYSRSTEPHNGLFQVYTESTDKCKLSLVEMDVFVYAAYEDTADLISLRVALKHNRTNTVYLANYLYGASCENVTVVIKESGQLVFRQTRTLQRLHCGSFPEEYSSKLLSVDLLRPTEKKHGCSYGKFTVQLTPTVFAIDS